jgi:uncharacterized protein (DUF1330 family)
MKTRYAVTMGVLAGVAIGATAINGLNAQAKPPSYVVIDIGELTDPEGFKAVTTSAAAGPARLAALGGRYVIRTETTTALDGIPPKRFVVLAFDSKEKAQGWDKGDQRHPRQNDKVTCFHRRGLCKLDFNRP